MQDTIAKPKTTHNNDFKELGFSKMETAELVTSMNKVLANYVIFYQKLRAFHWTIEGRDFFELHEKFEEDYNMAKKNIDDVAERIRIFGQMPLTSMSQMLEYSELKEPKMPLSPDAMVAEVVHDHRYLISLMVDVSDSAAKSGDVGTLDLLNGMIGQLEKRHWMYSSWMKK